ncbi:hypothetical protein [Amycolatopsis sp. CA-230715]|uniref:hypothetical protein n=1 Tax=Amycolatopsis sp. CA-230715 TaxID=2745196 RepID=UPI001C0376DC|nr:hypothetical protein [Amycolatopsis sp. CA-230715]QWF81039.1 hypothetical protein HUW46_04464 [Amycolatopsis sp. CA-230715]
MADHAGRVARLREHGCELTLLRGGHWRVRLPDGGICTLPSTASDWRSLRNAAHQIRRLGVDVRVSLRRRATNDNEATP